MFNEQFNIDNAKVKEINAFMGDPNNRLVNELVKVVNKYGTVDEINAAAEEAKKPANLMRRLENLGSPYLKDLEWLIEARDKGQFTAVSGFYREVLGSDTDLAGKSFNEGNAVTLEISALQYFPWLISEAKCAIEHKEIMPGRYIRVRKMKEQEGDNGDILAVAAAMQIIGASYVESLDTKGTDGSNVHLGGPETITGYFGGIGQPNDYALMWVDELLYYYTRYGINEVLNINAGTIMLGYLLYKMGINIKFKISVFMGNDNPYSVLWTLLMARMLSREDGTTPLVGFNLSNSVNNKTLELTSAVRHQLGLENKVRIEHHITETRKSIVRHPYDRLEELIEIAAAVPNISAKHEGGYPDMEEGLDHPSDILDYFRDKEEVNTSGDMEALENNYLVKHQAVNRTARKLVENGLSFIGAKNLHRR